MKECVVVGGGVAGIQAAVNLADNGVKVTIIEREPSIGGHMAMLDKTFPTNDCSLCILSPKMTEAARHPNVTILTMTEVKKISGSAGNFTVTVTKQPRYIKEEDCVGCGRCISVCPVEVYNRFDAGLGVRHAIYKPYAQAVPNLVVRDFKHCINCNLCEDICGKHAVLKQDEDSEKTFDLHADAIIIATGYTLFDAQKKSRFGYLKYADVITSIEFERMINAGGPTCGSLRRLSDGTTPKSVVFVQCVGSRDVSLHRNYCSCVCCMYALKNAMLIREHYPDTEVAILYNDLRAYGKGYEEYYERAKEAGIVFIRAFPGDVEETKDHLILPIENTETGECMNLTADLVILSVGMSPEPNTVRLAEELNIKLNCDSFLNAESMFAPAKSSVPGIFIAGTALAPKDIPDSVISGGAAASSAYIFMNFGGSN
ncbi:MAG TPA: CoB--CoM heterodisulfide reductase iron-sulfur subunit A family protein [Methanocorpusculum sp.]|nr:CoB--CoM heterodisulfide reductase iron-sulfur subunit A family protein [Methanocorpusculum sp.]